MSSICDKNIEHHRIDKHYQEIITTVQEQKLSALDTRVMKVSIMSDDAFRKHGGEVSGEGQNCIIFTTEEHISCIYFHCIYRTRGNVPPMRCSLQQQFDIVVRNEIKTLFANAIREKA